MNPACLTTGALRNPARNARAARSLADRTAGNSGTSRAPFSAVRHVVSAPRRRVP